MYITTTQLVVNLIDENKNNFKKFMPFQENLSLLLFSSLEGRHTTALTLTLPLSVNLSSTDIYQAGCHLELLVTKLEKGVLFGGATPSCDPKKKG